VSAVRRALAVVFLLSSARAASAHEGAPLAPHDAPGAWNGEPSVLLGVALVAWTYGRGVRMLWRRAGRGRGLRTWQASAFAGGLATLLLALVSPLDAMATALLSAHMVQHLALILGAAPLLVLGRPVVAVLWSAPAPTRRRLGSWWRRAGRLRAVAHVAAGPPAAWALHVATLWAWHLPGPYQAALTHEPVHLAEHASFLSTALLFWWAVFPPDGFGRLGPGLAVLCLFAAALQGGLLGAVMAFAGRPWYPAHAAAAAAWGLTPLEDQQLAGLLMGMPAGLVYLAAACVRFADWLRLAARTVAGYEGTTRSPEGPASAPR
jgi:putative membrane protein